MPPNAPWIFMDDGSLNWEMQVSNGVPRSTWTNPFSYLNNTQDVENIRLLNNLALYYIFLPGISLSINSGYTKSLGKEIIKQPRSAFSPESQSTIQGSSNFNNSNGASWILEPKLSLSKEIGHHQISSVFGATFQKNNSMRLMVQGRQYPTDAMLGSLSGAGVTQVQIDDNNEYKYTSIYGRIGYNLYDRYILNITGRRDGSSRFGPGHRFGNFGALGMAWIFSNERFFSPISRVINLAKIRASLGVTGNDQIGDYSFYNLYQVMQSKYGTATGLFPSALYNQDFAWEKTRKLEAAMELSMLDNRISTEVSWYKHRSSNQLIYAPLSGITGFTSVLSNFDATVENTGWEFVGRAELINSSNFKWSLSLNMSIQQNKLVKFDGLAESPYVDKYIVGEPLSLQRIYESKGVNTQTGLYEIVDRNGDGRINDLDRYLANVDPNPLYGGLNNSIQFRGIELSFLFQFARRNAQRYMPSPPGGPNNQPTYVLNRWETVGDVTPVQRFVTGYITGGNSFLFASNSNYSITDASFIRLKTISASYRFPLKWIQKFGLSESKFFIQGQNILTITGYEGLDPETGSGLPPLRMVTTGIQFKF